MPASARLDDRFVLREFEPAYLRLHREGLLADRIDLAVAELGHCHVCPRECGIDRLSDERKVCHVGREPLVSSAFPHFGEEDVLRGSRGSGTIFFSGCNLGCVFCQNADISQALHGHTVTAEELAGLMLRLQAHGCHNVNFVTPEHVAPQMLEAIGIAVEWGLRLPLVYNTSAYDSLTTLKLLDGVVDVYMPDFKVWDPETAHRLLKARDYPEHARAALEEMHRQVGVLKVGEDGIARRGVLLRHLVMPGLVAESEAILGWVAETLSKDTYVNVMGQYRPERLVGVRAGNGPRRYAEIDRRPTDAEIRAVYEAGRRTGLHRFDERA